MDQWIVGDLPKLQYFSIPTLHPQSLIAGKAATVFDLKTERKPLLSAHYDVFS
jgi:hypothetical protein